MWRKVCVLAARRSPATGTWESPGREWPSVVGMSCGWVSRCPGHASAGLRTWRAVATTTRQLGTRLLSPPQRFGEVLPPNVGTDSDFLSRCCRREGCSATLTKVLSLVCPGGVRVAFQRDPIAPAVWWRRASLVMAGASLLWTIAALFSGSLRPRLDAVHMAGIGSLLILSESAFVVGLALIATATGRVLGRNLRSWGLTAGSGPASVRAQSKPVELSGCGWLAMNYAIRLTADQENPYAALGCGAESCVHHHKTVASFRTAASMGSVLNSATVWQNAAHGWGLHLSDQHMKGTA